MFEYIDPRHQAARQALLAYLTEVSSSLSNPALALDEVDEVDGFYPPRGAFMVARDDTGRVIGCGAVRPLDDDIAEIKRMWIHPASRGRGLGSELLDRLEGFCRGGGYRAVRLDTNRSLVAAIGLYVTRGYESVPRYNQNPGATNFYEKQLASERSSHPSPNDGLIPLPATDGDERAQGRSSTSSM